MAVAAEHLGRLEVRIGREAMEAGEVRMLDRWSEAQRVSVIGKQPEWARGLTEDAYNRLRKLGRRKLVRDFVSTHPAEMNEMAMDDDALRILHRKHESFAAYKAEVEASKNLGEPIPWPDARRVRETGDYPSDDAFVHQGVYFGKVRVDTDAYDGTPWARLDIYGGRGEDVYAYAALERSLVPDWIFVDSRKVLYTFEGPFSFRTLAPDEVPLPGRMLRVGGSDATVELPVELAAELRAYQSLGLRYGDPRVGGFHFESVYDRRLAAEVQYMQATDPTMSLEDAIQKTTWYEQVERLASHLGFTVAGVRVPDLHPEMNRAAGQLLPLKSVPQGSWYDNPGAAGMFTRPESKLAEDAVSRLYDPDGSLIVETGFDIGIKLDPIE
jgi:hypothetical protein